MDPFSFYPDGRPRPVEKIAAKIDETILTLNYIVVTDYDDLLALKNDDSFTTGSLAKELELLKSGSGIAMFTGARPLRMEEYVVLIVAGDNVTPDELAHRVSTTVFLGYSLFAARQGLNVALTPELSISLSAVVGKLVSSYRSQKEPRLTSKTAVFQIDDAGNPTRLNAEGKTESAIWPSLLDQRRQQAAQIKHGYYQPLIRSVLLKNGFRIKEGRDDLDEYVYAAVTAVIAAALQSNGSATPLVSRESADSLLRAIATNGPAPIVAFRELEDVALLIQSGLATRILSRAAYHLAATPLARNYLLALDN